ncbi:MAG: hypothetical protein WCA21_12095 [Terracidiphilus sp.]
MKLIERMMKLEEHDINETEKTKIFWTITYFFVFITLSYCVFNAWNRTSIEPFGWHLAIDLAIKLVMIPIPLIMGVLFRNLLRKNLAKDLLSERMYQICNLWIAQLLCNSYLAMVILLG